MQLLGDEIVPGGRGDAASCLATEKIEAVSTALREQLHARCEQGDGRSCLIAGVVAMLDHDFATKAAFDLKAALADERSCNFGNADDCLPASQALATVKITDRQQRVRAVLEHGCEQGDAMSCLELSTAAPELTDERRAALRQRACDRGSARACLQIAIAAVAANMPDAPSTLAHATAFAEAACSLADEEACEDLASLVGWSGIPDTSARELAELTERACDHDQVLACAKLADSLTKGAEQRRDEVKARSLLERACKLGYPC